MGHFFENSANLLLIFFYNQKVFQFIFRSIHTRNCCIATGVFGCIFLILGVVVMLAGGPMLEVNIYKKYFKKLFKKYDDDFTNFFFFYVRKKSSSLWLYLKDRIDFKHG